MKNNRFQPTVSIVVPVKNGETTIGRLLESLKNVAYDPEKIEVIVVDGSSTDRTREIVVKYPVKLLIEERKGLNAARNTGMKNSTSEIIAFTDADCVAPSDWVNKIVENFKSSKVGCVGGNVKGYASDLLSQYADISIMPVMRIFKKRKVLDMIKLFFNYPAGCNMAFRRKVVDEIGCFDENLHYGADDLEFIERVGKAGYKIVLDPDVLILHKHRSTLRGLLKQTFNYGRGGALLFRQKGTGSVFSRWHILNLVSFFASLAIIISLIFFTLTTSSIIFPLLLMVIVGVPLLSLMAFYAVTNQKKANYKGIIVFPIIDFLRVIAFCIGEVYQLFKD